MAESMLEGGEQTDPENIFRILAASDIHLGYNENNPDRENDSFNTFEEILQIATKENVDFLLLGGDLFHENKPKPSCLQKAIDILRKYVFGARPVQFEYVGDPERDFKTLENPEVNYHNPNMNIALPIFTIHGNHDDPIGFRKTSAVDHLSSAKLLNHFGQWEDLNQVDVQPVLLQKGTTNLALFGLGSIKDERLNRLLRLEKVRFLRPAENMDDWFNLFVLHQNRVKQGPSNYIPESVLPSFLDLVIWGHEHECRIEPEVIEGDKNTFIIQPGSSIATSLSTGETVDKHVALLQIKGKKFRADKIKLQTVRPFLMDDLYVNDILEKTNLVGRPGALRMLEQYSEERVRQLIRDSNDKLTGHVNQPHAPLIRIRMFYTSEQEVFNAMKLSSLFANDVANDEIIVFKKLPSKREKGGKVDVGDFEEMFRNEENINLEGHVEEIVEKYFTEARTNKDNDKMLQIFSEKGLSQGVKHAVEKNDKDAIEVIIEHQLEKTINYLIGKKVTELTIEDEIRSYSESRYLRSDVEIEEAQQALKAGKKETKVKTGVARRGGGSSTAPPVRESRPAGSPATSSNGAGASDNGDDIQIISDDEDFIPVVGRGRGRARGRGQPRGPRGRPPAARGRGTPPAPAQMNSTPRGRGRPPNPVRQAAAKRKPFSFDDDSD